MKNVKKYQLKKCIMIELEEFQELFISLFGEFNEETNPIDVECSYDGICLTGIDDTELYEALSKYYDVKVTSVHADNFDYLGIWICYTED